MKTRLPKIGNNEGLITKIYVLLRFDNFRLLSYHTFARDPWLETQSIIFMDHSDGE